MVVQQGTWQISLILSVKETNFPQYMDNYVPLYTPASHILLSEQFEPRIHSTLTSTVLTERNERTDTIDVEMVSDVEPVVEPVDATDGNITEPSWDSKIKHIQWDKYLCVEKRQVDYVRVFEALKTHFIYEIFENMGFHKLFISWIIILYTDIVSLCLINGHKSNIFPIKTGVRQGCPFPMILYVLAKKTLYQAIKHIKPIELPYRETNLLGFADDTTKFVKTELSITYILLYLRIF